MGKLFKSKWLYVFLFVTACILMVNVVVTSMVRRNINEKRNISSVPQVIDTKTVYEIPEENEVSNPVFVEESEHEEFYEETSQDDTVEEEGFISPVNGEVLNGFTGNELVYSVTLKEYRVHKGIDIKAPILSQVYAVASGVVESVEKGALMGITVTIDHGNGFKSVYSNLSSEEMVKEGEAVKKGDIISGVGDTALIETGEDAHLHFELIKDGVQVDPWQYFE